MELWAPDARCANYYLFCCRFHLLAAPHQSERDELFCLHSDPEESLNTHEGRAKASLHIHVETKEPRLLPIAKSHFPLYYANASEMLASLTAFDTALQTGMLIVQREVLDRFAKN
jgi:hypothetical protein